MLMSLVRTSIRLSQINGNFKSSSHEMFNGPILSIVNLLMWFAMNVTAAMLEV